MIHTFIQPSLFLKRLRFLRPFGGAQRLTARLGDGRNRIAACQIAGVKPHFRVYEGNPIPFIISVNALRRHMSKGQVAMAVTEEEDGYKKLINGGTDQSVSEQLGVSRERIRQARTIRTYHPDLIDPVLLGTLGIDEAYARTLQTKREGDATGRGTRACRPIVLVPTRSPRHDPAGDLQQERGRETMPQSKAIKIRKQQERAAQRRPVCTRADNHRPYISLTGELRCTVCGASLRASERPQA